MFGKTDPINQLIKLDTDNELKVTGIYEDVPQNSQFDDLHFLASWDYFVAKNPYMSKSDQGFGAQSDQ